MKNKIIALMALLLSLPVAAVENYPEAVEKPVYHCNGGDGNSFSIEEGVNAALIKAFTGQNFYGDSSLPLLSKHNGVISSQSVYAIPGEGTLTLSWTKSIGRGGRGGPGRGGWDDSFGQQLSAKVVSHGQNHYFDCF